MDKLVFIHIPKTAGTTFTSILSQLVPPERRFHVYGGSITTARQYYVLAQSIFENLDRRIVDNVSVIHGHMPFVFQQRFAGFKFVTVLRNPLKRVISDYLYVKSTPTHPLFHIVNSLNIVDYVEQSSDLHLDNLQTRLICGKVLGDVTGVDLERAISNIDEHFSAVGFTEFFDYSVIKFRETLNWEKLPQYSKLNVGKSERIEFSRVEMSAIEKYNEFDLCLYDRLLARFKKEVSLNSDLFRAQLVPNEPFKSSATKYRLSLSRIFNIKK